ncbi:acyltransferase [Paenibacillus illinoisensis]|uniref:acyltransferase family protein n=1 Tax=Paenibacillus illinoisensis TaxID=59845 RepID=UPI001C8E5220|nr:acyltransferase family protein [Paenibacillus illinoisensis]MBY0220362.1 acyltransferase [Paenibacillus illinoisensis]
MSLRKERLFYLDFLRSISIFMIIVFHFNQQLGFHAIQSEGIFIQNFKNDNIGSIGITLFIILSGASLMYSYRNSFSLKQYIFKRILSIFPLFWIGYICTYFVLFFLNRGVHHDVETWKISLTIVGFDGFLYYKVPNFYLVGEWFIGFILIMYTIFPVLRLLVLKKPVVTIFLVLTSYIIIVQNYGSIFNIDVIHNPLTRLPDMVLGMLYVEYSEKIKKQFYLVPAVLTGLVLLTIKVSLTHIYVTFLLGSSLFITLAHLMKFVKNNNLQKPFIFMSKYSFAAFIIHHNLIGQLFVRYDTMILSTVETYALFFLVTIIIFWLSVHLVRISNKVSGIINDSKIGVRMNRKISL